MRFIREHKLLSAFIAVILVLFIIMVASYKTGGTGGPIARNVENAMVTIQKPFSSAGDAIKSNIKGIFKYKALLKENEELKEQIAALERENIKNSLTQNELNELRELTNVFNYESIGDSGSTVAASIVSLDGSNWFNLFTIDRGIESGIKTGSIVVNGDGLVGRVKEAGEGWSKVVSIIDDSNHVSFMVQRDMSLVGIVSGETDENLSGFMIDGEASVIEGDILVTSNIGIYPPGIKIGKVLSVNYNSDTQLKLVEIEPSVSFKSLQKVAVIL